MDSFQALIERSGIIDRREFIRLMFISALAPGFSLLKADESNRYLAEARHWTALSHKKVRCDLCPRSCVVDDQERGYCGVRENHLGRYKTLVYGRICALHIDPIEKKPLFHFLPGTQALSLATAGCNVNCKFCQNWEISQVRPEDVPAYYYSPQGLVNMAINQKTPTIAYTYSEPVIFYEYMFDIARRGQQSRPRIRSVMISGGYIQERPLKELLNVLDAVKIDLKAFTESFYKNYVNGELRPVLNTLKVLREEKIWFEIVYLVIPTLNDDPDSIQQMSSWMLDNLGESVPVHFTRFYPRYLIKNLPPTPVSTLERSREIAMKEGLKFVYVGNVPGNAGEHTYCPSCGKILIKRYGYYILENNIKGSACAFCGAQIPGVWV